MERRNVEKAISIYASLMMGEEIRRDGGVNQKLYEEYSQNAEVYEVLEMLTKQLNLKIYEYHNSLYMTAGEGNRIFGYSNEELRKMLGLRNNKELYLCYFIMYQVLLCFYNDTASYAFVDSVTLSDVLEKTTNALTMTMRELDVLVENEIEEHSFKAIALIWDELLPNQAEEIQGYRAARNSRTGYVKLVLNFMVEQELLMEAKESYYPTSRMKALVQNYFEDNRSRLYEILREEH